MLEPFFFKQPIYSNLKHRFEKEGTTIEEETFLLKISVIFLKRSHLDSSAV
jgi:hypothetical protein